MNYKNIIREEVEDFEWIKDSFSRLLIPGQKFIAIESVSTINRGEVFEVIKVERGEWDGYVTVELPTSSGSEWVTYDIGKIEAAIRDNKIEPYNEGINEQEDLDWIKDEEPKLSDWYQYWWEEFKKKVKRNRYGQYEIPKTNEMLPLSYQIQYLDRLLREMLPKEDGWTENQHNMGNHSSHLVHGINSIIFLKEKYGDVSEIETYMKRMESTFSFLIKRMLDDDL